MLSLLCFKKVGSFLTLNSFPPNFPVFSVADLCILPLLDFSIGNKIGSNFYRKKNLLLDYKSVGVMTFSQDYSLWIFAAVIKQNSLIYW